MKAKFRPVPVILSECFEAGKQLVRIALDQAGK